MKTVKHLIVLGLFFSTLLSYGENDKLINQGSFLYNKINNLKIEVKVENLKELESYLNIASLKDAFKKTKGNLEFILICKKSKAISNKDKVSYVLKGTAGNRGLFFKRLKKVHDSAKRYYETQTTSVSKTKITNFKIKVNAESLKALKDSFDGINFENIFTRTKIDGEMELIITCVKPKSINNKYENKVSYKMTGASKDKELFLDQANKGYKNAKSFFNN